LSRPRLCRVEGYNQIRTLEAAMSEKVFEGGMLAIMCNHRRETHEGKKPHRVGKNCRNINIDKQEIHVHIPAALNSAINELLVIVWTLGLKTCLLERLSNPASLRIDHRLTSFPPSLPCRAAYGPTLLHARNRQTEKKLKHGRFRFRNERGVLVNPPRAHCVSGY
jgi:hypothetical protein